MQELQLYDVLSGVVSNVMHIGVAQGLTRKELVKVAGLEPADLCNRDTPVAASKMMRLTHHIMTLRPNVHPALDMVRTLHTSDLGVISYALQNAATIGDAFTTLMRYQSLVTNLVSWQVEPQRGRITLGAIAPIAAFGIPVEGQLGMYVRLAHQLTGQRWRPTRVQFRHARKHPRKIYNDFFGIEVDHEAPINAISFSPELMSQPVVAAQPARLPAALALVDAYLCRQSRSDKEQLTAAMYVAIRKGISDKHSVAKSLGMSERTLSRRLRAEGTSFTEVLEQVRCELAKVWLRDPQLAIYEIVFLLGYNDTSTFYRAFRRWTGQTPAHWRAAQLETESTAPRRAIGTYSRM